MKVLIDNREFDIDFNDGESLGLVMEKVNEVLDKNGRLIFNMYINGRVLNHNDNIDASDISLVEVFTKSPRAIILEALSQFEEYFSKLEENSDVAEAHLQEGSDILGDFLFADLAQSLEWFNNILLSIKENTAVDLGNEKFEVLFGEYSNCFNSIMEAFEARDYSTFFEILDFEIFPVLENFGEIIEVLYSQILDEEKQHKFHA